MLKYHQHIISYCIPSLADFPIDLLKSGKQYTEEQQQSTLTLQLFGPKAFDEYLRAQVNKNLPSQSAIQVKNELMKLCASALRI